MKPINPAVSTFLDRLKVAQVTARDVYERAGIGRTTIWRWLRGDAPNIATLDRATQALDAIVAERAKLYTDLSTGARRG